MAFSLMVFWGASQATESCPELKKIEEVAGGAYGAYRADGEKGEWLGVLQNVTAKKTPVRSFEMALAIQEEASAPQKFQHCSYRVGARDILDMRFIPRNGKEFAIQTEGNAWKKEDGPFGLIYNVCEKTVPQNCKFTVNQEPMN